MPLAKHGLPVIGVEMFGCLDCCGVGDWWLGKIGDARKRAMDMMDREL